MMIGHIQTLLAGNEVFRTLSDTCAGLQPGATVSVDGLAGSLSALVLGGLHREVHRQMLIIGRDRETAEQLRDDLGLLLGTDPIPFFAGDEPGDVQTLRILAGGEKVVAVTHPAALLVGLPSPGTVTGSAISIDVGKPLSFVWIRDELDRLGFERKEFVGTSGDYAVRGGILDVFAFVGEHPVRVEFFGETVESIREFDVLSQRSIRELSRAVIVPNLLAQPETGKEGRSAGTVLDFLSPTALVALDEPELVRSSYENAVAHAGGTGSFGDIEALLSLFALLNLRSVSRPDSSVDFRGHPQPSFNSSVSVLRRSVAELQGKGFQVILACDSPSEVTRLKDLLALSPATEEPEDATGRDLDMTHIEFLHHALHAGFILPSSHLALYTEHQIFNRVKRRGKKRPPKFSGFTERELQQLHRGDYVVHEDFGIGKFVGLSKIRVRTIEQEVVRIRYAENDSLYVNLNYINKLQKYASREGHMPKLTRLGSPEWDRLRSRAKSRVKDIARDLLRLYAARKQSPGNPFSPDTPWQKELEASFMYEDTFDQAKATREVKDDMEAPTPMDRLVCGDVGFGKTEVAVRAAFKSVLGGKQVAVLVPTTILAMQHYNTFLDRTKRYGVSVQVLSRFKARKEQKEILEVLKSGGIDIIIGTHRLLSKDIAFKDLGLLIIDEEHRFGVAAKEKLRQIRVSVDTLSLTATPIPRTLHFSLMGARDLSIIATPPRNRLPITTEITRWNDDLIREAVRRELGRGGQVYFVHDRIEDIEEITTRLRDILPGIRLAFAHGQMHAHELEEVMMRFLEKKVDILVSTKIIESGLDIPNVNTIIVNRADRFGMAELYQLRGRVGRSNVQAYAYLLAPPLSVLPTGTIRRLQALQEFNELGSGFNLAMRDLEIRGAGNLLGGEQSGFIESMGFETYTRILEEAVQELKEEEFRDLFQKERSAPQPSRDTVVEPEFDALIPDLYVPNDTDRLALYRRLYALTTDHQLQEVADELKDRFGRFPAEVDNLIGAVRLRLLAAKAGLKKVTISAASMEVEFPPESDTAFYEGESFQAMMKRISQADGKGIALRQQGGSLKLFVDLGKNESGDEALRKGLEALSQFSSG